MKDKKYLIIDSRPYGLFSIFLHTVDNIKWAKENGYIPVVRWGPGRRDPNRGRKGANKASQLGHPKYVIDKENFLTEDSPPCLNNTSGLKHCRNLYWSPDGWRGTYNTWEYYFEPLNDTTVKQALTGDHKMSDIFMVGDFDFDISNKFLISNVHTYEPLLLWKLLGTPLEKEHRKKINKIISDNIKIRKDILKEVNSFYKKYFNEEVLGVHVRGTDKKLEYPHRALPISSYLKQIEEHVARKPNSKIYVASDNNESIYKIRELVGKEKLIVYPSVRANKYFAKNPICLTSATGPKHGEECLKEMLLLSKCNHIICTDSNVAATSIYMNPEAEVIYLNRIEGLR